MGSEVARADATTESPRVSGWHIAGAALLVGAVGTVVVLVATGSDDGDQSSGELSPTAVAPTAETDPVPPGGDADDPAIWVDPRDPAMSTVIGTDKTGGLAIYDLAGRQLQYLPGGDLNNVDLRDGFRLGGERVSIVAAADSRERTLAVYRVDRSTRELVDAAGREIPVGVKPYGFCMYRSPASGRFYAFVTSESKAGVVEQWELVGAGRRTAEATRVRRISVGSQSEGCVADDQRRDLYVSDEERGIWKYGAEPRSGTRRTLVDSTGRDGHLVAEVEGLTLTYGNGGAGYLVASSQGDSSFAVYRREAKNEYVTSFRIRRAEEIDGVVVTDGIDATEADLGPGFPHGLFVAQDGLDDSGRTNFKLVPLPPFLRDDQ